ncbi:MAG: DUF4259 domain-containing protein [Lachnospiraceae bacterium]|nr:DUF4259 domain-containing protein [Lachnospiraceae bacterium]
MYNKWRYKTKKKGETTMGCWSYQLLCDDVSLDVLEELADNEELLADLEGYLDEAIMAEYEYLEYDVCQYALTAAAIVDAALNGIDWALLTENGKEQPEFTEIIASAAEQGVGGLQEKAAKVIDLAIKEDSELRELWEENEEYYQIWLDNLKEIKGRLIK